MRGEAPRRRRPRVRNEAPPPRGWPEGFGRGEGERRALLVLATLRGIRPLELHALAWDEGSAARCVAAIRAGRAGSEGDRDVAVADPNEIDVSVRACGARLVTPGDREYLPGLLDLGDPPACLFARGKALTSFPSRVAVVGARNCSPTGKEIARDIGAGLGAAGTCVVSGVARGIDAAAQEGALHGAGTTIGVLGCGVDVHYPRENRPLFRRILERGTIVSEYPPGVPAEPHRFPARNRLIAALAEAVVIVEGAERSGSLITAEHALDIGRQVFALPGPVTSPLAATPLTLIRDGATLVRGAGDVLADLGLSDLRSVPPPADVTPVERRVLEVLAEARLPEAVAAAIGAPLPHVLSILLALEVKGVVRSRGGRYERRPSLRDP